MGARDATPSDVPDPAPVALPTEVDLSARHVVAALLDRTASLPERQALGICARVIEVHARLQRLAPARRRWVDGAGVIALASLTAASRACVDGHVLAAREWRLVDAATRALACLIDRAEEGADEPSGELRPLAPAFCGVDAVAIVRAACDAFTPLASTRAVTFRVSVPPRLPTVADGPKLATVVANLLFNAFKNAPRGGAVDCQLTTDPEADDVVLRVGDHGPGVPDGRAEAIFDQARQFHPSVFAGEGVGFSLHTSRVLMALHGGSLELRPGEGGRAVFEACWPRDPPRGVAIGPVGELPVAVARRAAEVARRELAVEESLHTRPLTRDDRPVVAAIGADRCFLRFVLEALEPEFVVAPILGPDDLSSRLVAVGPDVILFDAHVTSSRESPALVDAVRTGLQPVGVPIIVLAERDDPSFVVRLLECGVQDVLARRFLLPELRARVRNLVVGKRTADLLGATVGRQETDLVSLATRVSGHHEELERALRAVDEARRTAETASRVKSNFLRIMSHELKTPITAMQLQVRLIQSDEDIDRAPRLKEIIPRLARSSRRLVHLVDTILEWARAESGRLVLSVEPLDLGELVGGVLEEFDPHARLKGVALHGKAAGAGPPPMLGDRRLVRLLLVNLVTRALEVTQAGGIEVEAAAGSFGHRLTVRDSGVPLRAVARVELFEAMSAIRNLESRSGAGSGLGLHVVRDLVRAVGGELDIENGAWPGGAVSMTFPPTSAGERA